MTLPKAKKKSKIVNRNVQNFICFSHSQAIPPPPLSMETCEQSPSVIFHTFVFFGLLELSQPLQQSCEGFQKKNLM